MPNAPPNPVYQKTLTGLSALVSGAAAARVLDNALSDAGVTAARVRPVQMRALLTGPVLDELDRILPRSGLLRNLEALAGTLEPAGSQPVAAALNPVARTAHSWPASAEVARVRTEITRNTASSRERLEAAVLKLAAIDNVTLVAAIRQSGQTEFSRGAGDVAAIARVGMLALSLLTKSGSLKMFFVALEESTLLLFPWGSDAVLLTGKPNLNVGAVVTAFNDIVLSKEES